MGYISQCTSYHQHGSLCVIRQLPLVKSSHKYCRSPGSGNGFFATQHLFNLYRYLCQLLPTDLINPRGRGSDSFFKDTWNPLVVQLHSTGGSILSQFLRKLIGVLEPMKMYEVMHLVLHMFHVLAFTIYDDSCRFFRWLDLLCHERKVLPSDCQWYESIAVYHLTRRRSLRWIGHQQVFFSLHSM